MLVNKGWFNTDNYLRCVCTFGTGVEHKDFGDN